MTNKIGLEKKVLAALAAIALAVGFMVMACDQVPGPKPEKDDEPKNIEVKQPSAYPQGGTYEAAQNVTLLCATEGAAIYYTLDGSAPTAASAPYSETIAMDATKTLKAIAVKSGKTSGILTETYTINADGPDGGLTANVDVTATTANTSKLTFGTIQDQGAEQAWELKVTEKPVVYFAVQKEAAQTITKGGADAAKVTIAVEGTVDGETAGGELALFTVDTNDDELILDGGARQFTLTVAEDGKDSITIAVTLNVETDICGNGVSLFNRNADGQLVRIDAKKISNDTEAIDSIIEAGNWLQSNAVGGTHYLNLNEYVIRQEKDEEIKGVRFLNTTVEFIKIWLRGYGENRTITYNPDSLASTSAVATTFIDLASKSQNDNHKFVLENITLNGKNVKATQGQAVYLINAAKGFAIELKEGSRLIDVNGGNRVIQTTDNHYNSEDTEGGAVIMNGGEITNNKLNTTSSAKLIDNTSYGKFIYKSGKLSGNTIGDVPITTLDQAFKQTGDNALNEDEKAAILAALAGN